MSLDSGSNPSVKSFAPFVDIEINLSWSEYFKGKWQPRKTSNYDDPIKITPRKRLSFIRKDFVLKSFIASEQELYIDLVNENKSFKLYNTHSDPEKLNNSLGNTPVRIIQSIEGKLNMDYLKTEFKFDLNKFYIKTENQKYLHPIINLPFNGKSIEVKHDTSQLNEDLLSPFFVDDQRHLFFVNLEETKTNILRRVDVITYTPPAKPSEPPKLEPPKVEETKPVPVPTPVPVESPKRIPKERGTTPRKGGGIDIGAE